MATTKTDICNLALSLIGNERNQLTDVDTDANSISRQCLLHYDRALDEVLRMHPWNCAKGRTVLCTTEINEYPETIVVSGTGTDADQTYTYDGEVNEKYSYVGTGSASIENDGTKWILTDATASETWPNTTDCGKNVPKGFWGIGSGASPAPAISYQLLFGWINKSDLPVDCFRPIDLQYTNSPNRYYVRGVDWKVEGDLILSNNSNNYLLYVKTPLIADMDSLFLSVFYTYLAIKLVIPITGKPELKQTLSGEFNYLLTEARGVNGFEGSDRPEVDSEWLEATFTSTSSVNDSWPPFSAVDYGGYS